MIVRGEGTAINEVLGRENGLKCNVGFDQRKCFKGYGSLDEENAINNEEELSWENYYKHNEVLGEYNVVNENGRFSQENGFNLENLGKVKVIYENKESS